MRKTTLASLFVTLLGFSAFSAHANTPTALPATTVMPAVTQQVIAKVDLNNADVATLEKSLNGIGKTKAEAIVAYREANGPFDSVDELLEIRGIGKALLERNRDKLEVK